MPFKFSGQVSNKVAKLGVISDGDVFTADGYGTGVASTLFPYTIFLANPVRSATGVWSVTTKDQVVRVIDMEVRTLLPTGNYLGTQLKPTTFVASTGQAVLHWVFNNAGTPADLPAGGQFLVYLVYAETSV